MNLMKIFLLLFFTANYTESRSQKVIIHGKEGDRPLTWDDFKGKPDQDSPFGAYTFTAFQSKGRSFTYRGDTVVWVEPIEYWVELGNESWVKKDKRTDTLLQHEEGHFILGKLLVLELNLKMRSAVFLRRDYQLKINSIVKEVADKYKALSILYDKETNHSKNRPEQWKWNTFLATELKRLRNNIP
jgi:hypothetical protein